MSENVFNMPDLSSVTTEIDVTSLSSACSSLDASISSFNFNSGSFKSKFASLNSNGVGIECVNSIAEAVEKISSLVVAISGFLKTNISNQQSVDAALAAQANESNALDKLPSDQDSLANTSNTSKGSYGSSGSSGKKYNGSSSVSNKGKDLNVNENKNTNSSKLTDKFINELSVELLNIVKNDNKTMASILNDKKYDSIVNQVIQKVASNNSLTTTNINEIGIEVIMKQLLSMDGEGIVSNFSENLVGNYITNIAKINNMSTGDVVKKYSDYFSTLGNEIGGIANSDNTLLDVYDGNSVSKLSSDTLSFVRGVVDVSAHEKAISSEELLMDSNYSLLVNDRLNEISSMLKILR